MVTKHALATALVSTAGVRAGIVVAFLAAAVVSAAPASAQGWAPPVRNTPGRRPSVSPYLALGTGGSGFVNQSGGQMALPSTLGSLNAYANITQPGMQQQRMQAQQSRLGGQVGRLQSQLRGSKNSAADLASGMFISPTGRAATFSNFLHYYPSKKSSGR